MKRFSIKKVTFTKGFPGGTVVKTRLPVQEKVTLTRELGVGVG